MELFVLIKEQVCDVVEENVPANPSAEWKRKDNKGRALIGLPVEDTKFIHVKKAKTSKESWTILKDRYVLTNKISLLKRICDLQMLEDGDMEKHLYEMGDLVEKLTSLGEELAENMNVAMILRSLPDSYDPIIAVLENMPENGLTVGFITGKFTDEFKERMDLKSIDRKYSGSENSILKTSNGGRQFQRNCSYCDKPDT